MLLFLPAFPTLPNWAITLLAMVVYFLAEFITRSDKGMKFSIVFWIQDNKWNVILAFLIGILYYSVNPNLSSWEAMLLGSGPNLLIDWYQTFRQQRKLKV